jgi:hypothetical protein
VTTVTKGVRVVATFILLSGDKNDQPVRKNAAAALKPCAVFGHRRHQRD